MTTTAGGREGRQLLYVRAPSMFKMVSDESIANMAINLLVRGAQELGETNVTAADFPMKIPMLTCSYSTCLQCRVWYLYRYTTIGDRTCIVQFDCGGPLRPKSSGIT